MASEERGLYRLRTASDAPYASAYVYGRRESAGHKLGGIFAVVARLVASIIVLLAWVLGVWLYRDTPVELLADGKTMWLSASHLLIPVGFFCVAMTNRRYGPAYAFAQVVASAIVVVALVLVSGGAVNELFPLDRIPPMREAASFGGAFFAASFVSIVAFDGARGPNWWSAPLIGFLSAAIVFPLVFFAALYAGTGSDWLGHAGQYIGVLAGAAVVMLIPFWAMRRMIPPMSGFGGY